MGNPEPSSPQDAEVAKQYTTDYELWKKTAKYWTDLYAKGVKELRCFPLSQILSDLAEFYRMIPWSAGGAEGGPDASKIKQLMEMGFDREKSTWALAKAGGNVEAAIEKLFSM